MPILYRYILKNFLLTYIFGLVALCSIFLIVNLLESLDKFLDKNAGIDVIMLYYLNYFPEILKIMSPVGILLATLFSIGKLSTQNEITAMKSGGMSLYLLMTPLVILTLAMSFFQLYFNGWIVPVANQRKFAIENTYLHESKSGGPISNLYFRDSPTRNVIIQYYDSKLNIGYNTSIEDFTPEPSPRLVRKIEAKSIVWDSTSMQWKIINGVERRYEDKYVISKRIDTSFIQLNIDNIQISRIKRLPEEMDFNEMQQYIEMLSRGGKDTRKQVIEYYGNYAFPFANLIVVLFGVPFASVRRKGGMAIQIAAAMIVAVTYLVFTKLSQVIGYSTDFNPIVIAWSANIIFLIAALVIIYKTRT
jgi:lipopolysaccharide export system permease protein